MGLRNVAFRLQVRRAHALSLVGTHRGPAPTKGMLIERPGGFDYTTDSASWMKAAGFKETRVQHLGGPATMVIGIE